MIYLLISLALIYLFRFVIMFAGANIERKKTKKAFDNSQEFGSFVSVIIPARNEEGNIETALKSVLASDYPKDKFEIIAVNDRSTDKTGEIIERIAESFPNVKCVHLIEDNRSGNLKGKPGAIDAGIRASEGDIIMMTDADCTVHPGWISSVSSYFSSPDVGLVPSFTLIRTRKLFDIVQSLEWLYLHTMAAAGVGINLPLGCYGNNLTVRKDVYQKLGGYENIKFSVTEDLALLQAVHHSGYKVLYPTTYESSVQTLPVENFAEYVSQHRRWSLGGLKLGWIAFVFVFTTLSVWAGFILALIEGELLTGLSFFGLRIILDFALLLPAALEMRSNKHLIYSPIALLFFIIFEIIVPFLMINTTIKWKGQTFNKNS